MSFDEATGSVAASKPNRGAKLDTVRFGLNMKF